MGESTDLTMVLERAGRGDPDALERILPLVYDDLRAQAARYLRGERSDHTLQATALVHEAYVRLVDQTRVQWQNRDHFFAVAATAMRRILVNHARDRSRLKRGGRIRRGQFSETAALTTDPEVDLVALDDALTRLETMDPRAARVVELRYFGGLSVEDCARLLDVGTATIKRDWLLARTWLMRELGDTDSDSTEFRDAQSDA